jgi:hypothetical protein
VWKKGDVGTWNRFDSENRLLRTPFVEEAEVLDAELKARFGECRIKRGPRGGCGRKARF